MSGSKKCPQCAELIQMDALVCKHCKHKFPQPMSTGKAFAIVIGAILVLFFIYGGDENENITPEPKEVAPFVDATLRQGCSNSLAEMEGTKLIRGRPVFNRLVVDETLWEAIPATDKETVMGIAACAIHGRKMGDIQSGERIYVYGYRNGKQLALLNYSGVTFE